MMEDIERIREKLLKELEKLPEEQVKELKERIKKASQEELINMLNKLQPKCLFCQIINKEIETVKIYEDNEILAVLDLYPASLGHMLVMPKKHFQFIHEIPDGLLNKLFVFVKLMVPVLAEITKAEGINIYVAQGQLAGQTVPHFCINIIPRFRNDKIYFGWEKKKASKEELEKLAVQIREKARNVVEKREEEKSKQQKKKEEKEIEDILKHLKQRLP